jgi:hypothetical protein
MEVHWERERREGAIINLFATACEIEEFCIEIWFDLDYDTSQIV